MGRTCISVGDDGGIWDRCTIIDVKYMPWIEGGGMQFIRLKEVEVGAERLWWLHMH